MMNRSRSYLVVANEAGKNGQAGGVGGRPRVGPLFVRSHIPNRGRVGAPLSILQGGVVQLIQPAAVFLEDEHVTISVARLGIALDERIRWNGFGPGIAFIKKRSESDRHFGLCTIDNLIRNADCLVLYHARTEIGVEGYGGSNEINDVRRVGIDWRGGDIGVP